MAFSYVPNRNRVTGNGERAAGKSFNLHRDPLASRCRYFSEAMTQEDNSGDAIELPASFPAGSEALEVIALFFYGEDVMALDPFNVASMWCAAEFLGTRCDLYINQVVLQSWDDVSPVVLFYA